MTPEHDADGLAEVSRIYMNKWTRDVPDHTPNKPDFIWSAMKKKKQYRVGQLKDEPNCRVTRDS
jgi:hypothetical protein